MPLGVMSDTAQQCLCKGAGQAASHLLRRAERGTTSPSPPKESTLSDDKFTLSPCEEMMLWTQQHGLKVYDVVPGGRVTYPTSAGLHFSWIDG